MLTRMIISPMLQMALLALGMLGSVRRGTSMQARQNDRKASKCGNTWLHKQFGNSNRQYRKHLHQTRTELYRWVTGS